MASDVRRFLAPKGPREPADHPSRYADPETRRMLFRVLAAEVVARRGDGRRHLFRDRWQGRVDRLYYGSGYVVGCDLADPRHVELLSRLLAGRMLHAMVRRGHVDMERALDVAAAVGVHRVARACDPRRRGVRPRRMPPVQVP